MTTSGVSLFRCSRRESLGLLLATGVAARSNGSIGPAFNYQAIFSSEAEAWYTCFPILVTGNILSEKQRRNLRVNGTKLLAYVWIAAYYPGDEVSAPLDWQATVQQRRREWLLNREARGGGAAATGKLADWYDFGNLGFVTELARYLATRLKASGYDGFFFDALGSEHLPEPLANEVRNRYAGLDYNAAQGTLLRELRNHLPPGKLIFTNQGYRHSAAFLPYADLDLSESYFTGADPKTGTFFRKWWDRQVPWSSIKAPMERLVLPAARRYTHVRFVHLNYATEERDIQRAIWYSYACAKLFNHDSYLIVPGAEDRERDPVYFADLGKPVSPTYEEGLDDGVVWREYENGIVAINSGPGVGGVGGLKLADPPRGYIFTN